MYSLTLCACCCLCAQWRVLLLLVPAHIFIAFAVDARTYAVNSSVSGVRRLAAQCRASWNLAHLSWCKRAAVLLAAERSTQTQDKGMVLFIKARVNRLAHRLCLGRRVSEAAHTLHKFHVQELHGLSCQLVAARMHDVHSCTSKQRSNHAQSTRHVLPSLPWSCCRACCFACQ